MFVSRVTSKGRMYFYIYAYDSALSGIKTLHSLGHKDKAINKLSDWRDKAKIPEDLLALGLKKEEVEQWKKKIESL